MRNWVSAPALEAFVEARNRLMRLLGTRFDLKHLFYKMCAGGFESSPFSDDLVEKARQLLVQTLGDEQEPGALMCIPQGQPFLLHLLHHLLAKAGDPDAKVLLHGRSSYLGWGSAWLQGAHSSHSRGFRAES